MMNPDPKAADPDAARKAIFAALVALQDRGVAAGTSRRKVAESFGISDQLVAAVEREGLDKQWPPL
jgi:hypothetical protein